MSDLLQQEHHHVEATLAAHTHLGPRGSLRHYQVTRSVAERNNERSATEAETRVSASVSDQLGRLTDNSLSGTEM